MTPLDTKANRDSYGIDTYERGFIYAALLLRASNTDPSNTLDQTKNKFYNAVRIAFNFDVLRVTGIKPFVIVQAKVPYSSKAALINGGSFYKSVLEFGNKDPNPFLAVVNPSLPNNFPITQEPISVNTLEKYFVWTAKNLLCGYLSINDDVVPPIGIKILEEDRVISSLDISATLPFDYYTYLTQENLISAIDSVISESCSTFSLVPNPGGGSSTSFGNTIGLSNVSSLGN